VSIDRSNPIRPAARIDSVMGVLQSVATARHEPRRWGRALTLCVAGILVAGALLFTGLGLAASSFVDPSGDVNEAPDVTSVTVSASGDIVTVAVAVRNYPILPTNCWFNIWFDLDSNPETGIGGDEALVRTLADGSITFYRFNGVGLVTQPATGMSARYESGVLTFTGPSSAFGNPTSFGVLAIAARQQELAQYVAADFAPDDGRSAFVGPGSTAFPDPSGDQPAAPDVTSLRISDAKDGTVTFAITTANYETLPPSALIVLLIDQDGLRSKTAGGTDVAVAYQDDRVQLGRWDPVQEEYIGEEPPSRVQARNAGGVLTITVHKSEMADTQFFSVAIAAAHVSPNGLYAALDVAPDQLLWRYRLVNIPQVRLAAGKATGAPARPVAGELFTVRVPVSRSDTGRRIASGRAACTVRVGGVKVPAQGRVAGGTGHCSFRVPAAASGKRISGSIVVRSAGKVVTAKFGFAVR
jgi:hypothetical protein